MTHQMTDQGLQIDPLETIIAEIVAAYHLLISPVADLSATTPMGSQLRIQAERESVITELLEEVYAGSYPSTATGFQLDLISALSGTDRQEATKSYLLSTEADVQLNAGVTLAAGSVANVDGNPEARFVTTVAVTNPLGAPAWVPCAFEAEETGPLQALVSLLGTIAEPKPGWTNVRNTQDATLGRDIETDAAMRVRRVVELAQGGSTTVIAIAAELSAITNMLWVRVLENDTDSVDANGLPAHSVAPITYDGTAAAPYLVTDEEIAEAVWETKAGGIRSYGLELVSHEDELGDSHEIGETRATVLDLYIDVDVSTAGDYDTDLYPGGAGLLVLIKSTLVAWGLANLEIDEDVVYLRIVSVVMGIEGINDITALGIGWAPAPVGVVNLVVGQYEIADIDTANVTGTV